MLTAEQHYRTYLSITKRLGGADPDNAEYQRDLSISHERLGDLAIELGDSAAAEQHYRTSLTLRERLTAVDSDNAEEPQ